MANINTKLQRRDFLRHVAAGGAIVTMPAFLQGCSIAPVPVVADPMPEDPFLEWFQIDRAMIVRAMTELTSRGAENAEIFFQHRRQSTLRLEGGELEAPRMDILQGAAFRVVVGEKVGFAYTEDMTIDGLLMAARSAVMSLSGEALLPAAGFTAAPIGTAYPVQIAWESVADENKVSILKRVDSKARNADPSVDDVAVSWSDADERVLIATLDGKLILDNRPMTRLSAQVSATRGSESHSGFANIAARSDMSWYTNERVDTMVQEAVDRTLILFDARRPPSGDMPVMLAAGTSGVLLHETIGHSLEADFVREGKSVYAGKLNKRIADSSVSIVDQGTLANERGALNYDDEGNACGRTTLVENGVLQSYLHDSVSARQYGVDPTGSARRESYRHAPMPRMTCTFMGNGSYERDELIAEMGRGIIADTYTNGSVTLGAGDFSFYIRSGWLVEKGRILMPVRDFNLIGNGPDALRDIKMVANDFSLDKGGWTCGKKGQTVPVSQGMPTVLVSKLTVAIA